MNFEERKKQILSGQGMNYLYQCDQNLERYLVLGTVLRAIGHGWRVAVWTQDKGVLSLLDKLKERMGEDLLTVNEVVDEKVRLVVVNKWISLISLRKEFGKKVHVVAINVDGDFDLITKVETKIFNEKGVVAVTGAGKGKTTLGLGFALGWVLLGRKSLTVSWFKEKKNEGLSWNIGEHSFEQKADVDDFRILTTGLGFFGSPNMDRVKGEKSYQEHCRKAKEGMKLVRKEIKKGFEGLVVLDELIDTVKEIAQNIDYPLINLDELRNFLKELSSSNCRVVVTGRRVNEYWKDLVSVSYEMEKIKHPWSDMGLPAVMGLDY